MYQKLKHTALLTLSLALLISFGAVGTTHANSSTIGFACGGGSTGIKTATRTSGKQHQAVVTCQDGGKITLVSTDGSNRTGVDVTCDGNETSTVKLANSSKELVIYCQTPASPGEHGGQGGPAGDTPKVTQSTTTDTRCSDGSAPPKGDLSKCPPPATDPAIDSGNCSDVSKCDLITKYVNPFVNFLAALVGVVVVISIVIGAIQYGSSAGDPQKVSAAKNRIRNAIVALITFLFLYALLNFLIPGGLV